MKECLYRYYIRCNLLCSNTNLDTDYCLTLYKIKGGDTDGKKRYFPQPRWQPQRALFELEWFIFEPQR